MPSTDLAALLGNIRSRNRQRDVTGMLLYHDEQFLQCLEGPDAGVAQAYSRTRASNRHGDILELMNAPILHRNFAGLSMAFGMPNERDWVILEQSEWARDTSHRAARWFDVMGLSVLREMWLGHWQYTTAQLASDGRSGG